jgi:coenzyme F420-reducing hydrogenase alpha subunit
MKTIIHVNRSHIAQNIKDGGGRPVYTIKQGRRTIYAHAIRIVGGVVEMIDPRSRKKLSCGARAWVEVTDGTVEMIEPCSFSDAKRQTCPL